MTWLKEISGVISSIMVIIAFLTLVIPKSRNFISGKIKKTAKSDELNEKLNKMDEKFDKMASQLENQRQGIVCILGKDLKYMCNDILERGHITEEEYKVVKQCHDAYISSNGNGFINDLAIETMRLHKIVKVCDSH